MEDEIEGYVDHVANQALQSTGVERLPQQVIEATKQHTMRLVTLVQSLRAAGVDEEMVRMSIAQVLQSYEEELLAALLALSESDRK